MSQRTAILSGIFGQGGSTAADLYLEKGFRVIGVHRRDSLPDHCNVSHNLKNPMFELYEADICDESSIIALLKAEQPYAFLNFAAQSHVGSSYTQPIVTAEVDYIAVAKILEAIKNHSPHTKFWNANTSERYGLTDQDKQDENTNPSPISPYSCAKVASEFLIKCYRHTYGLHASYSIMHNYEGPRRSKAFVTRKITDYIGKTFNIVENYIIEHLGHNGFISTQDAYESCIQLGIIDPLHLGNLDTYRSWTHCRDTVRAVYMQVELEKPDDFVVGREEAHSIKDFLTEAFKVIGISDWSKLVVHDKKFIRPSDVRFLKPDCTKIRNILGWKPEISFKSMVEEMVRFDLSINKIR